MATALVLGVQIPRQIGDYVLVVLSSWPSSPSWGEAGGGGEQAGVPAPRFKNGLLSQVYRSLYPPPAPTGDAPGQVDGTSPAHRPPPPPMVAATQGLLFGFFRDLLQVQPTLDGARHLARSRTPFPIVLCLDFS